MNRRYFIKLAGSIVLGAACGMQMVRGAVAPSRQAYRDWLRLAPIDEFYSQITSDPGLPLIPGGQFKTAVARISDAIQEMLEEERRFRS